MIGCLGWNHGEENNIQNISGNMYLYWAIWVCRNDAVFRNTRASNPMQVIFRGTYKISLWALLQKDKDRPHVAWGCRVLEATVMDIFAKYCWLFTNRIEFGQSYGVVCSEIMDNYTHLLM